MCKRSVARAVVKKRLRVGAARLARNYILGIDLVETVWTFAGNEITIFRCFFSARLASGNTTPVI